jgi:hypothetical protein
MPACWGLLPLLLLGCASAAQNDDVPPAVSDRGVPKSSLDLIVLQALCIQHNISVDVGDDAKVPSLSTKRDSTKDALVVRLLNAGVSRAEIGLPLEPGSIEAQGAYCVLKGGVADAFICTRIKEAEDSYVAGCCVPALTICLCSAAA